MEEKKKIAVWFREEITDGEIKMQKVSLYTSFEKALEAHKDFVAEDKKWYKHLYGEDGFVEENGQTDDGALTDLYVEGEFCLNRVSSGVEMVEVEE